MTLSKKSKKLMEIAYESRDMEKQIRESPFSPNKKQYRELLKKAHGEISEYILMEAKARCPVDYGNLEDAIVLRIPRTAFYKQLAFIEVENRPIPQDENEGEWGPRKKPRTTHEYSYWANELIEPAGPKNLGPKSQAKQNSTTVQVGGKFIERAILENEEVVETIMQDLLEEMFKV